MNIRNMNLDNRRFDGSDSVANSDGRMSIPCRIKNDAIILKPDQLQRIDQFPFNVTLIVRKLDGGIFLSELIQKIFKRYIPIDIRLSCTE